MKLNYLLRYSPENGNFSPVHISLLVGTSVFSAAFALAKAMTAIFARPMTILAVKCKTLTVNVFAKENILLVFSVFSMFRIPYFCCKKVS